MVNHTVRVKMGSKRCVAAGHTVLNDQLAPTCPCCPVALYSTYSALFDKCTKIGIYFRAINNSQPSANFRAKRLLDRI